MFSVIQRVLGGLHRVEDLVLISALMTMLIIAVLQIFLRNFFDAGIFWAESFLRILVLWVAMLGAMVATRESNHINIDAISRFLSPRVTRLAGILTNGLSGLICGLVAWYAIEFVRFEYEDETIAFGQVPTWMCQAIIPFGFAVMALRFLRLALVGAPPPQIPLPPLPEEDAKP